MNTDPIEYKPLENIFQFLETDSDDLTDEALKETLRDRGLDPEATSALISEKVSGFLKKRRLSWQEAAKQKQDNLRAMASQVVSWSARKTEEVEAAFKAAQDGTYGAATQGQLQVAFRNLSQITTEDKASFLDEIDLLQQLVESDKSRSGENE